MLGNLKLNRKSNFSQENLLVSMHELNELLRESSAKNQDTAKSIGSSKGTFGHFRPNSKAGSVNNSARKALGNLGDFENI